MHECNQSKLLYKWENKVFQDCEQSYLTLNECREFVTSIWGHLVPNLPAPVICDGRGSSNARATEERISLPRWSRNYTVVLHELSHCLTHVMDLQDSMSHGGIFTHVYCTLLSRYGDHKYQMLVNSASSYGLAVQPIKIKSRLDLATSLILDAKHACN